MVEEKYFFCDWYTQVVEMYPFEFDFNVKDQGDISEGVDITVPPVYLAFIQIHLATRGQKEKIERMLEAPRDLSGCSPQKDGVINK